MSKILVSGSIVIDTLFDISSNINESINFKDGKLGRQNLMLTAHEKREFFGGTGGNIAYGLSLLGENPLLHSVAGKDFAYSYKKHLEKSGVDLRVFVDKNSYTATYYGMSDIIRQQVGVFQPNCYFKYAEKISLQKLISKKELQDISIAIFSPGTGRSILNGINEIRKINKETFIILDPGQALLYTFTKEILMDCIKKSDLLIINDIELSQIKNHFKLDLKDIFKLGIKFIIETQGEKGSTLHESHKATVVKTKAVKAIDPTGAGDAYRAGLIFGIIRGFPLEKSMKIGSKMGAECVKKQGGQTYRVNLPR